MRLNRLDLNLLVVLDALLKEKNITNAAQRIHLSQPATSGALARLREYFEDPLLIRVGSKMELTPRAESLINPVSNILMQIQATVEKQPVFDPIQSDKRFRIMMSDYTSTVMAPHLIAALAKAGPNIQLEIFPPSNDPNKDLDQGSIDFLILPANSFELDKKNPSTLLFFEDDFVCVGCKKNKSLNASFSLKQFLELGHVIVRFGVHRAPSIDVLLLARHGIRLRDEIVSSTFSAVPSYLVNTNRISTMHRRLANIWSSYLPLKLVPVPIEIPIVQWKIQWHRYRDHDPGIQWMRDFCISVCAEI